LLRFKNRAQFQAVLEARAIARSEHFALHRLELADRALASPFSDMAPAAQSPTLITGSAMSLGVPASPLSPKAPALFAPVGLWLGAMVPKRWAKRSVTRHAIKRQIQEVAQQCLPLDQKAAYLVRLRATYSREQFHSSSSMALKQAVRAELLTLMARLRPSD